MQRPGPSCSITRSPIARSLSSPAFIAALGRSSSNEAMAEALPGSELYAERMQRATTSSPRSLGACVGLHRARRLLRLLWLSIVSSQAKICRGSGASLRRRYRPARRALRERRAGGSRVRPEVLSLQASIGASGCRHPISEALTLDNARWTNEKEPNGSHNGRAGVRGSAWRAAKGVQALSGECWRIPDDSRRFQTVPEIGRAHV